MPKHPREGLGRCVLTRGDWTAATLAIGGWAGANIAASQQQLLLAAMLAALTLLVFLIWGAFLYRDRAV